MKLLITTLIISLFCSCSTFFESEPDFIFVDAEIKDINFQTDSTAILEIEVYKNSNAWADCKIGYLIDTYALFQVSTVFTTISNECELKKSYEAVVEGLEPGNYYYFQLINEGLFDIGGPNETGRALVGQSYGYKHK